MNIHTYYIVMIAMSILAVIVFIALHHFKAGYGYLRNSSWGPMINNKLGWVLMELPVFISMLVFFLYTESYRNLTVSIMTGFFLLHYFQRSLIFPFLMKGKSKIPVAIVAMGVTFNLVNVYMIGSWLFVFAPKEMYTTEWLTDLRFIIGSLVFIFGMAVNIHSDYIIRHLRKPGDTAHYIPMGGMFKYVSSANYYGEITEWLGFAILTWSMPGALFCIWTFANLAPRAFSLYDKYAEEFGEEFTSLHRKKVLPFIY